MNENMSMLFEQLYCRYQEFAMKVELSSNLVAVYPDLSRDNAFILTVTTIFPPTLDKNLDVIQNCLKGDVFDIRFGETINYTEFCFRPWGEIGP